MSMLEGKDMTKENQSILNSIIEKERYDFLSNKVVANEIWSKWEKFGYQNFVRRLKLYVGFLCVFTIGIILPELSYPEGTVDWIDFFRALDHWVFWPRALCEFFILYVALAKLIVEILELLEVGFLHHFWLCRGAVALENWSSILAIAGVLVAAG